MVDGTDAQPKRPTRRELRLAREAQERDSRTYSASANLPETGETAVIAPLSTASASSTGVAQEPLSAPRSRVAYLASILKSALTSGFSNGKRACVGLGVGVAVTALVAGMMALDYSNQAQAVASGSVLTDSVLTQTDAETPASLTGSESGQALAQAQQRKEVAQSIASDSSALCQGFSKGASSVVSAYIPEDTSAVYMPMAQGSYDLSSPYGWRTDPVFGGSQFHRGVDMSGPMGTPIYAVADGTVLSISEAGANNGIVIEHKVNGKVFTTWYLHSSSKQILVYAGQQVKAGQQIASRGSSGKSTGPHLHFEFHWGAGTGTSATEPLSALKSLGAMWVEQNCEY